MENAGNNDDKRTPRVMVNLLIIVIPPPSSLSPPPCGSPFLSIDPDTLLHQVEPFLKAPPPPEIHMVMDAQNQYEILEGMTSNTEIIHLHGTCTSLHHRVQRVRTSFQRLIQSTRCTMILGGLAGLGRWIIHRLLLPSPSSARASHPLERMGRWVMGVGATRAFQLSLCTTLVLGILGGCFRDRRWWRISRYTYLPIHSGEEVKMRRMEEGDGREGGDDREYFLLSRALCLQRSHDDGASMINMIAR